MKEECCSLAETKKGDVNQQYPWLNGGCWGPDEEGATASGYWYFARVTAGGNVMKGAATPRCRLDEERRRLMKATQEIDVFGQEEWWGDARGG